MDSLNLGNYLFGYNGIPIDLRVELDTESILYTVGGLFIAMLIALFIFGFVFL